MSRLAAARLASCTDELTPVPGFNGLDFLAVNSNVDTEMFPPLLQNRHSFGLESQTDGFFFLFELENLSF